MAIQYSILVNNARLDAVETQVGVSAVVKIYSGTIPASCAAAITGTTLATLNLVSDWMNAAASAQKTKLGTWTDASADAAGTATHFRIFATDGTTCGIQGTVTATGGGGDMTVDNAVFAAAQAFTINSFQLNAANL